MLPRQAALDDYADPEDPEEYLAEHIFLVPQEARWSNLRNKTRDANIGKICFREFLLVKAEGTVLRTIVGKGKRAP